MKDCIHHFLCIVVGRGTLPAIMTTDRAIFQSITILNDYRRENVNKVRSCQKRGLFIIEIFNQTSNENIQNCHQHFHMSRYHYINMGGCAMILPLCKLASCLSLLIESCPCRPAEQSSLYQTNHIITENSCKGSNECCYMKIKTLLTLCFSFCPTFVKWYRGSLEVVLQ